MLVEVVITFSCLLLSFVKGSESRLCSGPVCIPSDYNKLEPPTKYENRIYIWFPYVEVQKVDEDSGTITLTMKLATSWEEPRLNASWNKYLYYNKNYGTPLDEAFTEKLWMPDLFIHNIRKIENFRLNNEFESLKVKPYSYWSKVYGYEYYEQYPYVTHEINLEMIIDCAMNFELFPFDEHVCYLKIQSYNYPIQNITLDDDYYKEIEINENHAKQYLLGFHTQVKRIPKELRSKFLTNPDDRDNQDTVFEFSIRGLEIYLKRHSTRYIVNYSLPSGLLVTVSWVNNNFTNSKLGTLTI